MFDRVVNSPLHWCHKPGVFIVKAVVHKRLPENILAEGLQLRITSSVVFIGIFKNFYRWPWKWLIILQVAASYLVSVVENIFTQCF